MLYNNNMCSPLLNRHHVYKKNGEKDVELKEVGPRFEMKCNNIVIHALMHYIVSLIYVTQCMRSSWGLWIRLKLMWNGDSDPT